MKPTLKIFILGILVLTNSNAYSDSLNQAAMLANTCAGCHGPEGNSLGPATPNISGLSKLFIMDAMEAFKEDDRNATIMSRIAKGYSEQQIELIAQYFSQLPMQWPKQAVDISLAKAGEQLHIRYCADCHEDKGRSSEQDAGILANQKMPYLRYILDDVLNGKHDVSIKMSTKLKALHQQAGEQGLHQIIHFYGSQN